MQGGHIEGNGNKPLTLEIRIYYVFVLNMEIKNFIFSLLPSILDGFESAYFKFNSVSYLLAFHTFHLIHCRVCSRDDRSKQCFRKPFFFISLRAV